MGNNNQLQKLVFCFGMTDVFRHEQKTDFPWGDVPEGLSRQPCNLTETDPVGGHISKFP